MEISEELFDRFVIDLNDGISEENPTALVSCLEALFIGCCRNYEKKIAELKNEIEKLKKEREK